jgi:carboxyl-terminal processing protease
MLTLKHQSKTPKLLILLLLLGPSTSLICESVDLLPPEIPQPAQTLQPLEIHNSTNLTIVEQLRHNHYVKKELNDTTSGQIFEKFIESLDRGRAYFTAKDLEEFESYRYELDDLLKRGDLGPAFEIFNRYQTSVVNRLGFLIKKVGNNIEQINFNLSDEIRIDRKDSPWPANDQERDEVWKKRLKAAVLSLKLNDKSNEEISEQLLKRYKNQLKQTLQTKSEDAFQIYMNSFTKTYDPHTTYFSPRTSENFNINMSLSLEGIGAVLKTEEDHTAVVRLVPAGPADKEGTLEPTDKIIGVGQGKSGPFIDIVGWRLDDVVELIRGPKDSTVRLEIIHAESDVEITKVISIVRNTVRLEEQAARAKILELENEQSSSLIGVLDIPTFYIDFQGKQSGDRNYKSTTRDVKKLIERLKKKQVEAIIVDLRGNGGGSLEEARSLTGLFIDQGPMVQVKSARRRTSVLADQDDQVYWDGPLVVMVNRLSASASEIFAGAMQDYGRAIIVGNQTFGKGTVQTLIPLNRGQLKLTAAKFYRISGESTQHQGVIPDIHFPELYDSSKIGESSHDDAMPWDTIRPANYEIYSNMGPYINSMREAHKSRTADNAEFIYFKAIASRNKAFAERTHISLNEKIRIKEKLEDDSWRLNLENQLRLAKGKTLAKDLDHLDELEKEESEKDKDQIATEVETSSLESQEEIETIEDDALIEEAGFIALDLIGLNKSLASTN